MWKVGRVSGIVTRNLAVGYFPGCGWWVVRFQHCFRTGGEIGSAVGNGKTQPGSGILRPSAPSGRVSHGNLLALDSQENKEARTNESTIFSTRGLKNGDSERWVE